MLRQFKKEDEEFAYNPQGRRSRDTTRSSRSNPDASGERKSSGSPGRGISGMLSGRPARNSAIVATLTAACVLAWIAGTTGRKPQAHHDKALRKKLSERQIDKMVMDSFPASDPPSTY